MELKEKKTRVPRAKKTVEEKEVKGSAAPIMAAAHPLRTISKDSKPFDWKSFIPNEYVEINNFWASQNGISLKDLTPEQKEETKEKCGEENLIIKLAGFKYLAHLRGVSKIRYRVNNIKEDHVTAVCEMTLGEVSVKDGENLITFPEVTIEGVANATGLNTSYPFSMFLESMAENRAFIRAVKTAFNINILGAEELQDKPSVNPSVLDDDGGCTSPQESLRMLVEGKGKSFPDLLESLKKKDWADCDNWSDFKDVPPEHCFNIIESIISKKK